MVTDLTPRVYMRVRVELSVLVFVDMALVNLAQGLFYRRVE